MWRRTLLAAVLATACAAIVIAPGAAVAKPIMSATFSGGPLSSSDSCPLTITLTYPGKVPSGASLLWNYLPGGGGGQVALGPSPFTSFWLLDPGSVQSAQYFIVTLLSKKGKVLSSVTTSTFSLPDPCFPNGAFSTYP